VKLSSYMYVRDNFSRWSANSIKRLNILALSHIEICRAHLYGRIFNFLIEVLARVNLTHLPIPTESIPLPNAHEKIIDIELIPSF
jgi:hypothetical protein